jgi:citrate lyase subunit beta/citryl-CoA lyase
MAIGMSCGIGDYSDLDAWSQSARNAYAMGMTGALAIHPDQIPALNAAFGPSVSEIREAEMILTAWSERTSDVIALNGRMIDQPVVERARRLLSQAAPR